MEAIYSAREQTVLLSSLLELVSLGDIQALVRLNVIRVERDQQHHAQLIVTFRSKLTHQVFDEIQRSFRRTRGR